ncbi:hypothetical protein ABT122_30210, partial [Streptomyces sp. NPDC001985]
PWHHATGRVPPAVTAGHGDAPTALRAWAGDDTACQDAHQRLRAGHPVIAVFVERAERYTIIVWPVPVRPGTPMPAPLSAVRPW